jgi:DNA-binding beta-propeller fold protein YncE
VLGYASRSIEATSHDPRRMLWLVVWYRWLHFWIRMIGRTLPRCLLPLVLLSLIAAACSGSPVPVPGSTGGEQASVPGYRVARDVPLPGDTSRWDYQTLDASARRLYIAHLGASEIVVFDTRLQRVVSVVRGVDQVHGLVLAPDLNRLFASATGRNQVDVVDTTKLQLGPGIGTGNYPDGLAYAPGPGKVYVSNEHDSVDTVIDARTARRLGSIPIGGDIGNGQYYAGTGLVYVASGSDNHLVVVDPGRDVVLERVPLSGCDGAHGVQVDVPERRRVFVACEGNAKLVVLDLVIKRVMGVMDVDGGPDVLALDPGLHRLYVASESGSLAVFDTGPQVRKLGMGNAGPNAHSVAVDPGTHLVYLPLTDVRGHPVLRELVPA